MTETDDQRDMNGHTWTCSDACKEALAWKIARQNNEVQTCPTCGKEFIEKKKTFCSVPCYRQHVMIHGAMRKIQTVKNNCIICRKEFNCSVDQLARPLCSKECQDIFREKLRKNTEEEIKRLELAKREQLKKSIKSYILHNGLCGICRTSYIDCERMQSNFTYSPEGAIFRNSLIIKCPKFTKPTKKELEQIVTP